MARALRASRLCDSQNPVVSYIPSIHGISAVFLVLGIESSSVGFVLHYKIQSVVMQINGKILFQELDRSQKERRELQGEGTISRLSGLPPHV